MVAGSVGSEHNVITSYSIHYTKLYETDEGGSFIPPSPVSVNKRERDAAGLTASPIITAEPSVSVSSSQTKETQGKKPMSLFERLTGARSDSKMDMPEENEQPSLSVRAPRDEAPIQSQDSDDDLDIPAFLRRQVN